MGRSMEVKGKNLAGKITWRKAVDQSLERKERGKWEKGKKKLRFG